jgi:arylsulfatase A-like enzyme
VTPVRILKNTNREGAYRVPAMIRWTGHIKPVQGSNEIFTALDLFPTLLAATGDTDVTQRLLAGWQTGGAPRELPYLNGQQGKSRSSSTSPTTRNSCRFELEAGVLRAEDAWHP